MIAEDELIRHMTSLRTQYARHMKNAATGAARPPTYRQRWLMGKLNFLKPYIKKRLPVPSYTAHRPNSSPAADSHTAVF